MSLTVIGYLPLVSAGVWWSLCLYQVYRDRFRTWTEVFFLAACVATGVYGFSDFLFFIANDTSSAMKAGLLSFTAITFSVVFIFLFGIVFYTKMDRRYTLAFVPILVFLPFFWANLVGPAGLNQHETIAGYVWLGSWNPTWFSAWLVVILVYVLAAAYALFRTYREVARQTTKLRGRMLGLFLAVLLALILANLNTLRPITGMPSPPLFSSALAIPGVVSWISLSPLSKERFSVAVRRWKARAYEIKMAFLIYQDGTLIAAQVAPGEKLIDQDLFSATLDVIQNFMRTSLPALRGQWLRTITQGDYTLVLERGRSVYLVVVMVGEGSDQLRRQMRDGVLKFEADNRQVLEDWRGVPSEAQGATGLLLTLLEG